MRENVKRMFQMQISGCSTRKGTFAAVLPPATRLNSSIHRQPRHPHHGLVMCAAVKEQNSRPLRQQVTALFSAAALLASGLSTAGLQKVVFGMGSRSLY